MVEQRPDPEWGTRRSFLATAAGVGVAALGGLAGCAGRGTDAGGTGDVVVFHAGSLAPPFADTESQFESSTGLGVTREAWGSVEATRRVTAQGLRPDVLAVADFRLLRDRILPEFGDWYALFATNAMAIQYHSDAPGADRIGTDNWWEVLAREDVTVGHADPAMDPGGYRALMVLELGAVPFEGRRLYGERTRRRLRETAQVTTGNEVNLASQVRSGKVDYAIYYRSLGETSGLPYVTLQPSVDLSRSTPAYARHYATVEVETETGTYTGSPIAYGVTVPSGADRPDAGSRWVESLLAGQGRTDLRSNGLVPTETPVVPSGTGGAVPDRVRDHVAVRSSLGPLRLTSK